MENKLEEFLGLGAECGIPVQSSRLAGGWLSNQAYKRVSRHRSFYAAMIRFVVLFYKGADNLEMSRSCPNPKLKPFEHKVPRPTKLNLHLTVFRHKTSKDAKPACSPRQHTSCVAMAQSQSKTATRRSPQSQRSRNIYQYLPYLRLLPIITGAAWLTTLSTLFIYWLAQGRPRYPAQSNPYVAFISDIGAFVLQPLFIAGGTITAITLFGTILCIHLVFHREYGFENRVKPQRYEKVFSVLACLFQGISCPCQICLTVFDNKSYPRIHRMLLLGAFAGTALSAVCTIVVFWGEMSREEQAKELKIRRQSGVASTTIFGIEFCMGIAFTILLYLEFYRISGILEWIMAFLFTFYFWAFAGFLVLPAEEGGEGNNEYTPLLR